MPHQKTPLPAPIVAAAVLLICIAVQLMLAWMAAVVLLLLDNEIPAFSCCFAWVVLLPLFLVAELMKVGLSTLNGTAENIFVTGCRIQLFGAIAMLFAIFVTLYLHNYLIVGIRSNSGLYKFILYSIPIWFNVTALFGAGILLQNHSDKYSAWQSENQRPPEDAEYE